MLRATLRSLLARKLRLLLSAMAVVLGVSFVAGALTLTDTLGKVFDDLFVSVNAKTDVEVRGALALGEGEGERQPVPADLVTRVRAVEGVQAVVGDVSGYAQLLTKDGAAYSTGGAPSFGTNYDAEPATSPFTLRSGSPPSGPDQVALDAGTAEATGFVPGDRVTVLLSEARRELTVSGVFGFGDNDNIAGASIVAMDGPTAQALVGRPGEYDLLRVAGEPGVQPEELRDRVTAALPEGLSAVTGTQSSEESASQVQEALGFFNTFLLVFAAVALFVGAFLIFNTFTVLVAQRQRELALLRALGASRGQVVRSVLVEALVVGLVASALGLALGLGVALGLRQLINSFGATLPEGPLVVTARTVVASFVVGVLVTALAALLPARKASTVPPVAAMRDAATPEASLRVLSLAGAVLLALGVAGIAVGLTGELVVLGAGAVSAFLGVAALSPLISRPVARALGAPFVRRLPGRLGRLNAMRNPRRTASTAAALMIGLALVSAVSVLGDSAKASVEEVVDGALGADLVVQQTGGGFQGFSPDLARALDALPQVARADRVRFDEARVGSDTTFVTAVPAAAVGETVSLTAVDGELDRLGATTLLMSEAEAADGGLSVGEQVPVSFARGGEQQFTLVGTYEPNELAGPYLFELAAADSFSTRLDGSVLLRRAEGVAAGDLRGAVEQVTAAYPTVEVLDRTQFVEDQASQIDTVIDIISVLLALSVLIAVLGIVNTLALAVIERTREIGLLRAVGLARRQTRRMITVEAVIVAVFGALLGIVVGSAFGVAFQRALADEGVTGLSFPVGRLAVFVLVAAAAGVLAALLPARRAARLDVLRAIATT